MEVNTNMTSNVNYQIRNKKLEETPEEPSEQVILGSTEKDEILMMGDQLKKMKHCEDPMIASSVFFGMIGTVGGAVIGLCGGGPVVAVAAGCGFAGFLIGGVLGQDVS